MRETAAILSRRPGGRWSCSTRSAGHVDVRRRVDRVGGREFLHDAIGARTLFATHYHELVALADSRPRVRNVSVAVREHKGEICSAPRRRRKVRARSYGIDVSPARRAAALGDRTGAADHRSSSRAARLPLDLAVLASCLCPAAPPSPVLARLAAVDVHRITPLEALQLLAELKALT